MPMLFSWNELGHCNWTDTAHAQFFGHVTKPLAAITNPLQCTVYTNSNRSAGKAVRGGRGGGGEGMP
jgi:hypothetical protein